MQHQGPGELMGGLSHPVKSAAAQGKAQFFYISTWEHVPGITADFKVPDQ